MWMASILQVLALGAVDPAAPLAASAAPAPIYWRQTLFSIPFHVERPDRVTQEPVEVQLHVSPDRGVHWDNWRQAQPQEGHFLFRAGVDGEYWFDVRTLDRSGQVRPQGPHTPKLIVIVDTVPPKVQLTAVRGDAGQITAAFRIEELYPKLDSLAIEYRLAPTAAWQAVPVGPKDVRSNNAEHTGEVTWYPQNASGTMEIRLRVSDMAGNPAESHTLACPLGRRQRQIPCDRRWGPSRQFRPERTRWARRRRSRLPQLPAPASPAPATATASPAVAAKAADPWQPLGPQTGRTPWPAENASPATAESAKPPASQNDPGNGSVAIRVNPPVTQQFVADQPAGIALGARRTACPGEPVQRVHRQPPERAGRRFRRPPATSARRRACRFAGSTRGSSNSPTTPAPWAAQANVPVELWGTRDGGKSWQSFGKDPNGQSPMLVTVPDDGIYGFRMVLQNGPGMAGRPPLPGDVPGIWIGIDLTRPVGRITRAQQGIGRDGDKLFITWEASDNRELAAKPISLSYSERSGGPWTADGRRPGKQRAVCVATHRQPAATDVFAAGDSRCGRQHGRLRNAGAGAARSFQPRRAASRSASPRPAQLSAG